MDYPEPSILYSRTSGIDSQHSLHRNHWAAHQDAGMGLSGFDVTIIDDMDHVVSVIGLFGLTTE